MVWMPFKSSKNLNKFHEMFRIFFFFTTYHVSKQIPFFQKQEKVGKHIKYLKTLNYPLM